MRKTLLCFLALCVAPALVRADASESVVNVSYATGDEVPLRGDHFNPDGKRLAIALNFAPPNGKDLVVMRNAGTGLIRGRFTNLVQGQIVTLRYRGAPYHFVANYYHGDAKDLVLTPINLGDLSADAREKLDSQLVLALKKSRGEAPFDRATSLRPEDYERDGAVLVDIHGAISSELVNRIAEAGADVVGGTQTATALRAWVGFGKLENLANVAGIESISAARPSVTHTLTR